MANRWAHFKGLYFFLILKSTIMGMIIANLPKFSAQSLFSFISVRIFILFICHSMKYSLFLESYYYKDPCILNDEKKKNKES